MYSEAPTNPNGRIRISRKPTPRNRSARVNQLIRRVLPRALITSCATTAIADPMLSPDMATRATPAPRHRSPSRTTTAGSPAAIIRPVPAAAPTMDQCSARRYAAAKRLRSSAIRENAGNNVIAPTWMMPIWGISAIRCPYRKKPKAAVLRTRPTTSASTAVRSPRADHREDERKAEPRQLAPHREGGMASAGPPGCEHPEGDYPGDVGGVRADDHGPHAPPERGQAYRHHRVTDGDGRPHDQPPFDAELALQNRLRDVRQRVDEQDARGRGGDQTGSAAVEDDADHGCCREAAQACGRADHQGDPEHCLVGVGQVALALH